MRLEAEDGITPDAWVILEINYEGDTIRKILSGWSGSYLYGDSWRLSSPIRNVDRDTDKDYAIVETYSGSSYKLYYMSENLRMSNAGIYNQLIERHGDKVKMVEL